MVEPPPWCNLLGGPEEEREEPSSPGPVEVERTREHEDDEGPPRDVALSRRIKRNISGGGRALL